MKTCGLCWWPQITCPLEIQLGRLWRLPDSSTVEVESGRLKNKLSFGRERSPTRPKSLPPPLSCQRVGGQTPPGPRDLYWPGLCLFSASGPSSPRNTSRRRLSGERSETWWCCLVEGEGSHLHACSHLVLTSHLAVCLGTSHTWVDIRKIMDQPRAGQPAHR